MLDQRLIQLRDGDNIAVLKCALPAGETVTIDGVPRVVSSQDLVLGHKVALTLIPAGEKILKMGVPIGSASCDIAIGSHVHVHNIQSDYTPTRVHENN
jgi:hypothetical protein